jgi:GTPase SAR1 family protein
MEKQHFVFIGAGGVGKSAIRCLWCYQEKLDRDPNYDPTIEAIDQRQILVDGKEVLIQITDSGFQFDPDSPKDYNANLIKEADGFVFIYSITDQSSLPFITQKYEEILKIKNLDKCPMVLVSNKMDLENSIQQVIPSDAGLTLAKKLNIPFITTCALKNRVMNIDDIFVSLVKETRKLTQQEKSRSNCIIA